jgi:hypothetical protein
MSEQLILLVGDTVSIKTQRQNGLTRLGVVTRVEGLWFYWASVFGGKAQKSRLTRVDRILKTGAAILKEPSKMSKRYQIQDDAGNVIVASESITNGKAAYAALAKLNNPKFFVATSHDGKPFERVSPHYFKYRGKKHVAFKDGIGDWRVGRLDYDGYDLVGYPDPYTAEQGFIASQEAARARHEGFCARQDGQGRQAAHGESHAQQSPQPQEGGMSLNVIKANQRISEGVSVCETVRGLEIQLEDTGKDDRDGWPIVKIEGEFYRMIDSEGAVCGFDQLQGAPETWVEREDHEQLEQQFQEGNYPEKITLEQIGESFVVVYDPEIIQAVIYALGDQILEARAPSALAVKDYWELLDGKYEIVYWTCAENPYLASTVFNLNHGKSESEHPQPVEQPQESGGGFAAPQVAKLFRALQADLKALRDTALREAADDNEAADVEAYYLDKGKAEAYGHALQLVFPQVAEVFWALQIDLKNLRDAALRDARGHAVEPADVEVYYHDKGRVEAYNRVLQLVEIILGEDSSKPPAQSKSEGGK